MTVNRISELSKGGKRNVHFVDRIYALYREQLHGEETACAVVLSLLEKHKREHIIVLIEEMEDEEVTQMMGIYLMEALKVRMVQDGKMCGPCRGLQRPFVH